VERAVVVWATPGPEFPQLKIAQRNRYEHAEEELCGAEIILSTSLRPEQFEVARNLRWIHASSAAVHHLLSAELVRSDVVVTNPREVHGPVVAEHVLALIFALAKKIPQAAVLQHRHIWGQEAIWKEGVHPREIAGATLGLVGVGSIGRRVAQRAAALGMRAIAVREHVEKETPEGVEEVFPASALDEKESPEGAQKKSTSIGARRGVEAIRLRRAGCATDFRDERADQCCPPRRDETQRLPDQCWPRGPG
jgi:phosphoglycerate dehydrogenase-like enzyme